MNLPNDNFQIKFVGRQEIDTAKYDGCIESAKNSLIYGFSWFLDSVCEDWACLILNDYEAVFPLPLRQKYGLNYVFLPPWVQQLGVFYVKPISPEIFQLFFKKIPKNIRFIDVFLNAQNNFPTNRVAVRINYIKNLKSENSCSTGYSKGRKSAVNQAIKNGIYCKYVGHPEDLIDLHRRFYTDGQLRSERELKKLTDLIEVLKIKNKVDLLSVFDSESNLLGGAVLTKHHNRVTYLFSVQSADGRKKQALSFLIDYALHFYRQKFEIFDFEGSMNKSIASFFKSFGVEEEPYFHYRSLFTQLFQVVVKTKQ
ncbi:MAG: hypothetical protein WBN16_09725 [Lutimonas sp.]